MLPGQPADPLIDLITSVRTDSKPWAVVFGAGLSVPSGIPTWNRLATSAADKFDIYHGPDLNPRKFANALGEAEARAPDEFWAFITDEVCRAVPPSPAHKALAAMPFELFVSLNFDCLFEQCFSVKSETISAVAYPDIELRNIGEHRLLYLHGRCPADGSMLNSDCAVLTTASYERAYGLGSILDQVVGFLVTEFNLLFVGTSLEDSDIGRVMNEIGRRVKSGHPTNARNRTRIAFVPTMASTYVTGLEYSWGGPMEIEPIFYRTPDDNDHSELDQVLNYLAKAMERSS